MQTAGLHEKDADVPLRHEAEGNAVYEKHGSERVVYEAGGKSKRQSAFELPT